MPHREEIVSPVRVTSGPKQHFFGYYDKEQWSPGGRYLLTHEVDFTGRPPRPEDEARIGLVDTEDGFNLRQVSKTSAWCWQQGSMLQWIPDEGERIIHNDRIGDRFVSVVLDRQGNREKVLPRPIYTLSNDGKRALSLNFSRNADSRPGYGYAGLIDQGGEEPCPAEDGIYLVDLETGDHRLIISLAEIVETDPQSPGREVKHWFNHLLFSPDDERFIFLHRWRGEGERSFDTRICTAEADGSDVFISDLQFASHFIWFDEHRFIVWGRTEKEGDGYYLIEDRTDEKRTVGSGQLKRDGHCNLSPDGNWMLTDEYPDETDMRKLILYNFERDLRVDMGRFYSPPELSGEIRCDLHPRWSRDGKYVCIDSAHQGKRDMYLLKVDEITNA